MSTATSDVESSLREEVAHHYSFSDLSTITFDVESEAHSQEFALFRDSLESRDTNEGAMDSEFYLDLFWRSLLGRYEHDKNDFVGKDVFHATCLYIFGGQDPRNVQVWTYPVELDWLHDHCYDFGIDPSFFADHVSAVHCSRQHHPISVANLCWSILYMIGFEKRHGKLPFLQEDTVGMFGQISFTTLRKKRRSTV